MTAKGNRNTSFSASFTGLNLRAVLMLVSLALMAAPRPTCAAEHNISIEATAMKPRRTCLRIAPASRHRNEHSVSGMVVIAAADDCGLGPVVTAGRGEEVGVDVFILHLV